MWEWMAVSTGDTTGVVDMSVIGEDTEEVLATAVSRGDIGGVATAVLEKTPTGWWRRQ